MSTLYFIIIYLFPPTFDFFKKAYAAICNRMRGHKNNENSALRWCETEKCIDCFDWWFDVRMETFNLWSEIKIVSYLSRHELGYNNDASVGGIVVARNPAWFSISIELCFCFFLNKIKQTSFIRIYILPNVIIIRAFKKQTTPFFLSHNIKPIYIPICKCVFPV